MSQQKGKGKGRRELPAQSFGPDAEHMREKVFCFYCGKQLARWGLEITVDHVTPLSRGGRDVVENRVFACVGCNRAKGSSHWSFFAQSLPPERFVIVTEALKNHDAAFHIRRRRRKKHRARRAA